MWVRESSSTAPLLDGSSISRMNMSPVYRNLLECSDPALCPNLRFGSSSGIMHPQHGSLVQYFPDVSQPSWALHILELSLGLCPRRVDLPKDRNILKWESFPCMGTLCWHQLHAAAVPPAVLVIALWLCASVGLQARGLGALTGPRSLQSFVCTELRHSPWGNVPPAGKYCNCMNWCSSTWDSSAEVVDSPSFFGTPDAYSLNEETGVGDDLDLWYDVSCFWGSSCKACPLLTDKGHSQKWWSYQQAQGESQLTQSDLLIKTFSCKSVLATQASFASNKSNKTGDYKWSNDCRWTSDVSDWHFLAVKKRCKVLQLWVCKYSWKVSCFFSTTGQKYSANPQVSGKVRKRRGRKRKAVHRHKSHV